MLQSIEGIILHTVKYRETSVIATIYTKEFGRQSYLINSVRTKRSAQKAGLLQPLYLLDLIAYQKPTRDIHRIKEFKSHHAYQNIPFDMVKTAQVLFLAEMLYKTIHEQESFPEMFDFIKNALMYFDLSDSGSANFHLYFLFRLTEYLGFLPDTEIVGSEGWFDLKAGNIAPFEPSHPFFAPKDLTASFIQLGKIRIQEMGQLAFSRQERERILEVLLEYYKLHFENLGEVKSLRVLKEVFES